MKQGIVVLLLTFAVATLGHAAATRFTDLEVTGTLTAGGCTCTNISSATLNTQTVNSTTVNSTSVNVSTVSISGSQGLRLTGGSISPSSTPAALGILARDSGNVLYISTSTAPSGWQKVGAQ